MSERFPGTLSANPDKLGKRSEAVDALSLVVFVSLLIMDWRSDNEPVEVEIFLLDANEDKVWLVDFVEGRKGLVDWGDDGAIWLVRDDERKAREEVSWESVPLVESFDLVKKIKRNLQYSVNPQVKLTVSIKRESFAEKSVGDEIFYWRIFFTKWSQITLNIFSLKSGCVVAIRQKHSTETKGKTMIAQFIGVLVFQALISLKT